MRRCCKDAVHVPPNAFGIFEFYKTLYAMAALVLGFENASVQEIEVAAHLCSDVDFSLLNVAFDIAEGQVPTGSYIPAHV